PESKGSSHVTVEATTVVLPRGGRHRSKPKSSPTKPSPRLNATHGKGKAGKPAAKKPGSQAPRKPAAPGHHARPRNHAAPGANAQPGNHAPPGAAGANKVALPPQLAAVQASVNAQLAGSAASMQALSFYRIPLFLLPIYQAAAA